MESFESLLLPCQLNLCPEFVCVCVREISMSTSSSPRLDCILENLFLCSSMNTASCLLHLPQRMVVLPHHHASAVLVLVLFLTTKSWCCSQSLVINFLQTALAVFDCLWITDLFLLKGRLIERSSICWLTPQMAAMAVVSQSKNQEPPLDFLCWCRVPGT